MATKPHAPAKPVSSKQELEELLLEGLESGEPTPFSDKDWEELRRRALDKVELRKLG